MLFPRISEEVADRVYAESHYGFGDGTDVRRDRVIREYERLTKVNPAIGDFLTRVGHLPNYRENPAVLIHSYGYAVDVYRLVEEETKRQGLPMPLVAHGVGAPIQTQFWRNIRRFVSDGLIVLRSENPIIIAIAGDWIIPFHNLDNGPAVQKVTDVGFLTYSFLKGQWDTDELKKLVG